jgi:putative membrane protein
MINRFFLHIITNATAIVVSEWLIPGVIFQYEFWSLLKIAVIMAIVNSLVKPIVKLIFSPIILITLGLFTLAINLFMIWLVTKLAPELSIIGLNAYFWTMIIVGASNLVISTSSKK